MLSRSAAFRGALVAALITVAVTSVPAFTSTVTAFAAVMQTHC